MRVVLSFATEVDWHEGHQIARALRRAGHAVHLVNVREFAGEMHGEATDGFAPDAGLDEVAGDADLFFYIEPRGLLPRGLERARIPTLCALADVNVSLEPRADVARLFDHVRIYRFGYETAFSQHQPGHVRAMPLAIDPEWSYPPAGDGARDLDVAFKGRAAGTWESRKAILDALAARFTMSDPSEPIAYREMPRLYRRSKIVVNPTVLDGLNPRIFEAMACGALLMTSSDRSGVERLFTDAEHLVRFTDRDDLVAKAEYILARDDERLRIARAGCDEVQRHHTWDVRVKTLLEELRGADPEGAPARSLPQRDVDAIYERHYKQAGRVEALWRTGSRAAAVITALRRT